MTGPPEAEVCGLPVPPPDRCDTCGDTVEAYVFDHTDGTYHCRPCWQSKPTQENTMQTHEHPTAQGMNDTATPAATNPWTWLVNNRRALLGVLNVFALSAAYFLLGFYVGSHR